MSTLDEKSKEEYVRKIVDYSNQLKANQTKYKYIELTTDKEEDL